MTLAAVGLGANLGDAAATLRDAIDALARWPDIQILRASRLYRTPAWGRTEQPDFINAVALVETGLPARDLLDALLATERTFGRTRRDRERWGPRTLDLDLLLYGDAVIDAPGLRVPHPHLHERAFAMLPLAEIAPQATIPGIGMVGEVAAGMAADGIEALP
jgi:2-amino-4-hydroxy-6-hydroxymethyldihydropteridine diphosphokinase